MLIHSYSMTAMNNQNLSIQEESLTPVPVVNGAQQGSTQIVGSQDSTSYIRSSDNVTVTDIADLEVDDTVGMRDFLAKPVPVATGSFSTADAVLDLKFQARIYDLILAQSIWLNKLHGYLNMRGTVKLRLVINPTPFQAGLARLSVFPCENVLVQEARMHLYDRVTISQLPGAFLNFNDNFVEVSVPYLSPTTYLQRDLYSSGEHVDWGSVYIHVFTPLNTGTGPSTVSYTLWMSVEDLELSGMVIPQGIDSLGSSSSSQVQDQEAKQGPLGKIMANTTRLASSLGAIPSLLPLSKQAAWVTRALGGFADAFGWSKPSVTPESMVNVIGAHSNAVHTKGHDPSVPLSLDPGNKIISISSASPDGADEMSFNFIKTRWAVYQAYPWSTSDNSGDTLISKEVSPLSMQILHVVGATPFYSIVPAAALAKVYNNFRGSFEFRLRIIKTGFHTGTLSISYLPGKKTTPLAYTDAPYVYRQILDIQEGTEFCYTLPYLLAQDFIGVQESMGMFTVHVVNPLRAPETVSSQIRIYLEIRGGSDLIYTHPKGCNISPFVPQGVDIDTIGLADCVVLGASDPSDTGVAHCQLSNGEIQQSCLELLKASHSLLFRPSIDRPGINDVSSFAVARAGSVRWDGSAFTSCEYGGDLFSWFYSMFALSRGSMRYRILPLGSSDVPAFRAMILGPSDLIGGNDWPVYFTTNYPPAVSSPWVKTLMSSNAALTDQLGDSSRVYQSPSINSGLAVQIPFYSKYRFMLNRLYATTGLSGQSFAPEVSVAFKCNSGTVAQVQRSVGDDFQLAYFVGVPTFITNSEFYVNA
nr:MAG: capsid protein [brine shrimp dicistro-like virus 1]